MLRAAMALVVATAVLTSCEFKLEPDPPTKSNTRVTGTVVHALTGSPVQASVHVFERTNGWSQGWPQPDPNVLRPAGIVQVDTDEQGRFAIAVVMQSDKTYIVHAYADEFTFWTTDDGEFGYFDVIELERRAEQNVVIRMTRNVERVAAGE